MKLKTEKDGSQNDAGESGFFSFIQVTRKPHFQRIIRYGVGQGPGNLPCNSSPRKTCETLVFAFGNCRSGTARSLLHRSLNEKRQPIETSAHVTSSNSQKRFSLIGIQHLRCCISCSIVAAGCAGSNQKYVPRAPNGTSCGGRLVSKYQDHE